MSEASAPLNSNPEILLKKRKNADRLRLEKQEAARKREEELKRKKQAKRKGKFIRAETLVAKHRSTEREKYRIKRVSNYDREHKSDEETADVESDSRLQFIIRIPGPHGAKIPNKARKILSLLRLEHNYSGIFIKANSTIKPLLRIIAPYIVLGQPSLATIRKLIQKRAKVEVDIDEEERANSKTPEVTKKTIILNDNNLVEEKLGDYGVICIEDIIHEIVTLGENFKACIKFLKPFELNPPVNGWGPLSKLKRMELREAKKELKVSNAGSAPLVEIDIDQYIADQI